MPELLVASTPRVSLATRPERREYSRQFGSHPGNPGVIGIRAHCPAAIGQDCCGLHVLVVVFDRQYSPFIFKFQGQEIVPAESVYAVFEAKQTVNAALLEYAMTKAATVRRLYRTSLPIPTTSGVLSAKKPGPILAGILAFESDWKPPLGQSLLNALKQGTEDDRLDMGCIAAHGTFTCDAAGFHRVIPLGKPATAFLFELIARLQELATVPMIDVRAYAKWLSDDGQQ